MRRAKLLPALKLRSLSLKIYGLCLVAITLIHVLHGLEPGASAMLDRANAALQRAEKVFFWLLVLVAALAIIAREINVVKWITAVRRIAGDKVNRWVISLKELAYSSLIGAGAYWAYACMAELF